VRTYVAVFSNGGRWIAAAKRSDDPERMVITGNYYDKNIPDELLDMMCDLLDTSALRVHADFSSQ